MGNAQKKRFIFVDLGELDSLCRFGRIGFSKYIWKNWVLSRFGNLEKLRNWRRSENWSRSHPKHCWWVNGEPGIVASSACDGLGLY